MNIISLRLLENTTIFRHLCSHRHPPPSRTNYRTWRHWSLQPIQWTTRRLKSFPFREEVCWNTYVLERTVSRTSNRYPFKMFTTLAHWWFERTPLIRWKERSRVLSALVWKNWSLKKGVSHNIPIYLFIVILLSIIDAWIGIIISSTSQSHYLANRWCGREV